jgi:N-acyl-D-amino-acid deacylase
MFDFLIKDVAVLDGLGGPAIQADVAIAGGRIAVIGDVDGEARRVIDGAGLVASPGFIDIHSHTDAGLLIDPTAQSKVTQGITLEVCGQCGFSSAPCLDEPGRADLDSWRERHGIEPDWRTMDEFLSVLEARDIGVNFITLVGHSNVRAAVVGLANREASPTELEEMRTLVAQAMEQGAFGLSSGLIYPPSCFAGTSELAALAEAAAPYGGIYASHIRSEREGIVDAVEEAIEVGKRGGVPVQIAHHKACGSHNWGKVNTTLAMIREAREAGYDVTVDQYPYTASATSLSIFLPKSAHDGGDEAMVRRIRENRAELLAHLKSSNEPGGSIASDGGWSSVVISSVRTDSNRRFEGMNLVRIAESRGASPEDTVLDLLVEENAAVSMVHFAQCEEDIKVVMQCEFAMIGTDASARSTSGELAKGKPHPRSFGSFPRVLGRYVREQNVIPLETAIRKMTSMPAAKLGLSDRGVLREGNWADVVVFDPETVADRATYEHPHQISTGIGYVFVNGVLTVEQGELTGALAGRVLRRNSAALR